ncbi:MAG TPA: hypothetical protein VGS19_28645 [Streptosporangiaceae bacterium]|nr:hypothetical protein [Streptosporangiaceae bacterium]
MSPPQPATAATSRARNPMLRPHVSEWFGHRVFPEVSASPAAVSDQRAGRCPFLSGTLGRSTSCVKAENSKGVCTISASSNGPRQDWLVCPYRALDDRLLASIVRRLYDIADGTDVLIRPVVSLQDDTGRAEILTAASGEGTARAFVYFQDKLGGEIGLSPTPASPELSFDITVVELLPADPATTPALPGVATPPVRIGKYGVIELQTMDTHGSYKHAVTALANALDLHGDSFPQMLAGNPEWAGRRIEGPNISNVFKRTFYQIAFKFQVTARDTSAGCALALPKPVWDSWQPFLGAPELHEHPDGTWRLLDDQHAHPSDWIYVFDIGEEPSPGGGPAALDTGLVIGTDAATLSRAAFDIAPAKAVSYGDGTDAVVTAIMRRLTRYLPVA